MLIIPTVIIQWGWFSDFENHSNKPLAIWVLIAWIIGTPIVAYIHKEDKKTKIPCHSCGDDIKTDWKACPWCGERVEWTPPYMGWPPQVFPRRWYDVILKVYEIIAGVAAYILVLGIVGIIVVLTFFECR